MVRDQDAVKPRASVPKISGGTITARIASRLAFRAAIATLVSIVVPSFYGIVFSDAQFVGASDDAVQDVAVNRYGPYLTRVGAAMGGLAASLWLLFFGVVLGLLLLIHIRRKKDFVGRNGALVALGISALFAAAYWGFVANLHPGLFLGTLSGGRGYVIWVQIAYVLAPTMLVLGAVGLLLSLWRGTGRWRATLGPVIALAIAAWGGGIYWAKHTPRTVTGYPKGLPKLVEAPKEWKDKGKPPPSILFIAVDSLRPDRIDAENTPNLKKLLDQGIYFPHALVTVPRTGPSWAAELTSLSPITNGIETMFPTQAQGNLSKIALPAELAAKGYRTGVYSEYAGEFFGRIDAGFQVMAVPRVELAEITGQTLLARAPLVLAQTGMWYTMGQQERFLLGSPLAPLVRGMPNFAWSKVLADDLTTTLDTDQLAGDPRPYFALVFYSQPHFPYTSSAPYYKHYRKSGYSPQIAFGRDATNETPVSTPEDKAQLDGLYRAALAESDHAIGELLERLRARKKLDDTIIVLTADHGEGLYECPTCVGHGDNLHSMVSLTIPLVFVLPKDRYPDAKPHVEDRWVSQLDVTPTLRSLLGYQRIAIHEGVELLTPKGAVNPVPERIFTAETGEWLWTTNAVPKDRLEYPPITGIAKLEHNRIVIDEKYMPVIRAAKHRAAIKFPFKLSYEPSRDAVHFHLYKVDDDPWEEHDVAAQYPAIEKQLSDELFAKILGHTQMLRTGDYLITRPTPPPEEEF
jgi:arylsulfatase A-like enzyme